MVDMKIDQRRSNLSDIPPIRIRPGTLKASRRVTVSRLTRSSIHLCIGLFTVHEREREGARGGAELQVAGESFKKDGKMDLCVFHKERGIRMKRCEKTGIRNVHGR